MITWSRLALGLVVLGALSQNSRSETVASTQLAKEMLDSVDKHIMASDQAFLDESIIRRQGSPLALADAYHRKGCRELRLASFMVGLAWTASNVGDITEDMNAAIAEREDLIHEREGQVVCD